MAVKQFIIYFYNHKYSYTKAVFYRDDENDYTHPYFLHTLREDGIRFHKISFTITPKQIRHITVHALAEGEWPVEGALFYSGLEGIYYQPGQELS